MWSDFRAAAQALTYHEGNDVFQWGLVNAFPAPFSFVGSQLANGLVDYNSNPPRPRFEEPDVIEAMRLYTGLYLIDQVAPDFTGPEAAERQQELIQLGRAAMWPDSFDSFQAYEQVLNVGVAPYPANQANPNSTMVIVNGLVMSAEARNPEAAWMWMDFLARQPLANTLPARTSVAEASGYWQDIDAELEEVMRQALSNSFVFQPGVTNFVFTTAVADILNGDKSVEDALLDAQAEGEHLLSIDIGEPEFTVEHQNMDENDNSSAITFITDNNLEPYYILAEQFEAETGIGVEVRSRYSYSTNDRLTFREMAQSSDCFHAGPEMQDAANLDVILNLTPFVEADPTFDLADFYTSLVEQFTYQGQLWALPADFEPILIEYNRDLFDAAHVPYPVSTWTMDDFLETAVALTADEGETKQYGFVPDAVEFNIMRQMLAQFGVRLVDNRIDPPTVHLTEPTVIEAVRWYTNLSNAHGVKPVFLIDPLSALSEGGDPGIYFEERTRLISNNQAAMWTRFGVSSGGYSLNDSTNLPHVGIVPLPSVPDVPIGSIVNVTGYYISINTQNREPCWEWINYLTQFVESAVGMPGRHSIAESEDYYQRVGEAVALAQQVSVEHAEISPFVTDDEWLDYSSLWLARAVSKITLDEVPVEEALEVAQQTFDAYRACIIDKNAFTNYEEQSQCALEVDPSLAVILDNANR